jgi:hypothetical protein
MRLLQDYQHPFHNIITAVTAGGKATESSELLRAFFSATLGSKAEQAITKKSNNSGNNGGEGEEKMELRDDEQAEQQLTDATGCRGGNCSIQEQREEAYLGPLGTARVVV